ncbi:hypothetical protein D9757_011148 [Collybiopsis confluens]|uniref:Uncharacterized protein n=1 Tax=Collybiopsis confluens TaxID=2823264 RepID=A0A8H5H866_9AGAR|nr:hypothetical protein D9757_011148 [Collybiopsis confluens]
MYTLKAFTVAVAAIVFGAVVSTAEPIARDDIVYHCDVPPTTSTSALKCPPGYRCCGPISTTLGGT